VTERIEAGLVGRGGVVGVRLLGPLELVVGRRSINIGGPRQRVVLATLALKANQVTSFEQLVDAVWGSSPPTTARAQIQASISGLRKLLADAGEPTTIKTHQSGYRLEVTAGELDSAEFAGQVSDARAQAEDGRIAEAAATLRGALALWRGPALDGIDSHVVQRGATLLEDARLAAVEDRARLDLQLGRHEEIGGELQALVDENPLRERLYQLLALALYRSGRQADALEVCRTARDTLVDEMGIEPGRELRDLERAILNHDPELDLPPTGAEESGPADERAGTRPVTPRQLPGSIADFVGREGHLADIKRHLADSGDHSARYAVRIVAISGKGGVGKSSLAIRVAHELDDVFPDGHLYADLQASDGDELTATLIARFLRALGVSGSMVPEDTQERVEMYRTRLAGKRLLVVLDDVISERQVQPLLPGGPSCAVIVTSRMRLSGLAGADCVDVDVFDVDKSLEMLTRIVGRQRIAAERDAAVELVRLCGGLPLALRIAGARLASRPTWRISELVRRLGNEARRLDEFTHHGLELRCNIGLTYRSLPALARRLFRLCALLEAPDFPGWTAAALLDADPLDAEDVLNSLVDAQMLDTIEYPGPRVRYRFHPLIRVYAREQLLATDSPAARRNALERVLGAWLALAEAAHRAEYGGDYTTLHGNAPRWSVADHTDADSVSNPMDWWEAERSALVAAVRQAAAAGLDELCWDLALTSVTLFETKGYFDDWRETARLALDAAERAGNRTGSAAMRYSLGLMHLYPKHLTEAEKHLTAALRMFDADGNTHGKALVLRHLAVVDRLHGNREAMLAKYTSALEMMQAVGDPVGEANVLRILAKFRIDEGDTGVAQDMLDWAFELCRQVKYLRGEAQTVNCYAELYLTTGQNARARHALHRVLLIVREIGDLIGEAHALYGLGIVRRREGKLDNAETTLSHALSLAEQVDERLIKAKVLYTLGDIELARGNGAAARDRLVDARRLFDELGAAPWQARSLILLAEIDEDNGDFTAAGQQLDLAANVLSGIDSQAANQLSAQVEKMRSALLSESSADSTRPLD
jgi:DNA-binding SARP family transcriptional activator